MGAVEGRSYRMVLRYHEQFGHWYVPNLRAYVPHERGYFVVTTNSLGMRSSRNYSPQAPAGVTRLLLFGDSYTAGEGVNNDERFSDRLESLVEGLEVLNFGLNGSGPEQQWLVFDQLADAFGGGLIVWCPQVENIRRVTLQWWPALDRETGRLLAVPKPYGVVRDGRFEVQGVPVSRQRLRFEDAPEAFRSQFQLDGSSRSFRAEVAARLPERVKPIVQRLTRYQPYPQYDDNQTPEWQAIRAIAIRFLQRAQGRAVVIAPLPNFYYIEGRSQPTYLTRYQELARECPALHLIDVLPHFRALAPSGRRACRYPHDVHYTPLGHAVAARALVTELRAHGLLGHEETVSG